MKIAKQSWGSCSDAEIFLFELADESGMCACVSNYGGLLQSLWVKNGRGEIADVVLGYDTLAEYQTGDTFFGAMVGPIADRLGDGCCILNGRKVQFELNAGPDCMHSGSAGFHAQIWNWEILQDGIAFVRSFEPGELQLPGRLNVRLAYRICGGNTLRLEYEAECDCETALSFTNHSYFNLNGARGTCLNQRLSLNADVYAETRRDSDPICTGRVLPVDDTPMDLRGGGVLADVLSRDSFSEIRTGGGLDHYFPVRGSGMREHASLECAESGLKMVCRSDAPGVLVYTANGLESESGKNGATYGKNWAVCLETERFPNAVNMPHLRGQVLLQPGAKFESATEFSFIRL